MKLSIEALRDTDANALAEISHELKTPLSIILGFADVIEEEGGLSEAQRRSLAVMRRNGENILRMVDDIILLDRSRVQRSERREAFCVKDLVDDVEQSFRIKATKKKIDLRVTCTEVPRIKFYSDPAKVRQVLFNLLDNAIKFTDVGHVWLDIKYYREDVDRGVLIFDVADSGVGVDLATVGRLFDRYSRSENDTCRAVPGHGLGLFISKRIAGELGGDLTILRGRPNEGSTWRFAFRVQTLEHAEGDSIGV